MVASWDALHGLDQEFYDELDETARQVAQAQQEEFERIRRQTAELARPRPVGLHVAEHAMSVVTKVGDPEPRRRPRNAFPTHGMGHLATANATLGFATPEGTQ
jgi:hypothetical protein